LAIITAIQKSKELPIPQIELLNEDTAMKNLLHVAASDTSVSLEFTYDYRH